MCNSMDEQKESGPPQKKRSIGAESGSAGERDNGKVQGRERDSNLDFLREWGGCDHGGSRDSVRSRDEGVISSDCSGRARRLHGESGVVRRIVGAATATTAVATNAVATTAAVATGTIATASQATDASEGLHSVALVAHKGPGAVLADVASTACSAMIGLFTRGNGQKKKECPDRPCLP
jgi:hypothetical protein